MMIASAVSLLLVFTTAPQTVLGSRRATASSKATDPLRIASFNIQKFGDAKMKRQQVVDVILNVMRNCSPSDAPYPPILGQFPNLGPLDIFLESLEMFRKKNWRVPFGTQRAEAEGMSKKEQRH
jgi:hypothetical protein